jgi:hypothetical protein
MLDVLVCIRVFMKRTYVYVYSWFAYDVLWNFIMYKICIKWFICICIQTYFGAYAYIHNYIY